MKLLITVLMSICFLESCQNAKGVETHKYDGYLSEFNADITRLGYTPIDFSETTIREDSDLQAHGEPFLGYCYEIAVKHSGFVNISVRPELSTYGHDVIKALIYHELGHCFLGLDHTDKHSFMNGGNIRTLFTYQEITTENTRLALVKEMVESSPYR